MVAGSPIAGREPRAGSRFLAHLRQALLLDRSLYAELDADPSAVRQGAWVVRLVALAAAIGTVLLVGWHAGALVGAVVGAVIHWLVWAGVNVLIVRWILHREVSGRRMLAAMGFAQAPQVIAVLGFLPWIGPVIVVAGRVLAAISGHRAFEETTGIGRRGAVLTTAIGFGLGLAISTLLEAMLGDIGLLETVLRP